MWDALHGYAEPTPIADVDVLFFDADEVTRERECAIEAALAEAMPGVPWSVKNQARVHRRDGDAPYADTADALRFWLEIPTAVAIRIREDGGALLLAQPSKTKPRTASRIPISQYIGLRIYSSFSTCVLRRLCLRALAGATKPMNRVRNRGDARG